MLKLKNKKGMTLVELVTVIAVIGIMTSVTIVAFGQLKNRSDLDAESEKLISVIRQAQNYALTGRGGQFNLSCPYYYIHFHRSSGKYEIRNHESGGVICGGPYSYSGYELERGVSFDQDGEYANLVFSVPHANLETVSGLNFSGVWHRIDLKKGSIKQYICFNSAGAIKKSLKTTCD